MKIYWSKEEGTKNIIGKKIKALRKATGITQKQLAEKLQLQGHEFSDLTILRIEQGTRFVPDYEIVILADYFGITTDELLRDTENQKNDSPPIYNVILLRCKDNVPCIYYAYSRMTLFLLTIKGISKLSTILLISHRGQSFFILRCSL